MDNDTSRAMPRDQFDYFRNRMNCPENMRGGMQRYLEHGIPPGGYMTAVLCNDLMTAMGKADLISRATMPQLCMYLYNDVPMNCRGNKQAVDQWIAEGGLIGKGLLRVPDNDATEAGQ